MCDTETETESTPLADEYGDLSQLFKEPDRTSQEVVRSVFDLKHVEIRTYFTTVEHPHSSSGELAEKLDRHRRHISRSLRGLHDANLVKREKQTFDSGGTGYIYDPVPVEEAKQYLQTQLDEWVAHLQTEIETLDSEIEAEIASDGGANDCSCSQGDKH